MDTNPGRRDFLKLGAGLGAAATFTGAGLSARGSLESAAESASASPKPIDTVRVGFVGVGVKGSEHLANLLRQTARN